MDALIAGARWPSIDTRFLHLQSMTWPGPADSAWAGRPVAPSAVGVREGHGREGLSLSPPLSLTARAARTRDALATHDNTGVEEQASSASARNRNYAVGLLLSRPQLSARNSSRSLNTMLDFLSQPQLPVGFPVAATTTCLISSRSYSYMLDFLSRPQLSVGCSLAAQKYAVDLH